MKLIDKYYEAKFRKEEERKLLNIYSKTEEGSLKIMEIKDNKFISRGNYFCSIIAGLGALWAILTQLFPIFGSRDSELYYGLVGGLCGMGTMYGVMHMFEYLSKGRERSKEAKKAKAEIVEKLRRK